MQCKNNLTENENLDSTETCDNYTHSMCDDTCDILNINVYTCTKDITTNTSTVRTQTVPELSSQPLTVGSQPVNTCVLTFSKDRQ